tara:strand:+ start:243 stop:1154 length:912 start_codon:yes stop_codon:yes gene_type:complete
MRVDKKQLWKQAIKWPLYSVAIIPIFICGAYNFYTFKDIKFLNFLGFTISSVLLLVWENLTNDLYDSETGIDQFKFHSIVNLIKNKKLIFLIAYLSLFLGLLIIYIISLSQSKNILILIILSCALGYLYQGPPFRLGYLGLGEPLCWLAFGPLAFAAGLIALNPIDIYISKIPWQESFLLGTGPALSITLVLFCSHFHQIKDDKKYGKSSPLVLMGTKKSASLVPWIIIFIYSFQTFTIFIEFIPKSCILYLISLPYAFKLISILNKHYYNPRALRDCKFIALKFQSLNGFGLIMGLLFNSFL